MSIETENYYLFVNQNMPPPAAWDPRDAIVAWLAAKDRRAREPTKAKNQRWFEGIFQESHDEAEQRTNIESEINEWNSDCEEIFDD